MNENEQMSVTLGVVAMEPKGEYNPEEYYEKLNVVTYNGSSYMAKQNVNGVLPTNETFWQLVAKKGDTPVKGVDYYTEDEKQQLIDEILRQINQ